MPEKKQKKPKYEAPVLISLGEVTTGSGYCSPGSGVGTAQSNCATGAGAQINCRTGNNANTRCFNGPSAGDGGKIDRCSSGAAADPRCSVGTGVV
jgi:hypothetical protein